MINIAIPHLATRHSQPLIGKKANTILLFNASINVIYTNFSDVCSKCDILSCTLNDLRKIYNLLYIYFSLFVVSFFCVIINYLLCKWLITVEQ